MKNTFIEKKIREFRDHWERHEFTGSLTDWDYISQFLSTALQEAQEEGWLKGMREGKQIGWLRAKQQNKTEEVK